MIRYCGRNFSPDEIRRISGLVEEDPSRMRAELSRLACELLDWRKPNGGLKDMSCRVAMIRMNRDGLISLPPPTRQKPVCKIIPGPRTDPQPFITAPVHELSSVRLQRVLTLSDWDISFGYRPVLMETFVEKKRFKGTCYKAANWVKVGQTKGRGKLGPSGKVSVPIKDIWLYPLTRKFRALLTL